MPEEKKRLTVRRGARVEVGISADAEETRRPSLEDAAAAGGDAPKTGALYADDEDEPLLRRREPGALVFYDLGTRLRSVAPATNFEDFTRTRPAADPLPVPDAAAGNFNEYLETEIDGEAENLRALASPGLPSHVRDPYALGNYNVNADVPAAVQSAFDAACLGKLREGSGDALSPLDRFKANGSGRRLPACAPFPFRSQPSADPADYHESGEYLTEAFDFELHSEEKTFRFPNARVRERVEDLRAAADDSPEPGADVDTAAVFAAMTKLGNEHWRERAHKAGTEDGERWNPNNYAQGEATHGAEHEQKGQAGRFDLSVRSRLIFEPFDTGDAANFKVTREPRFDAEGVEFDISGATPARVFLRPQLLAFGRSERWQAFIGIQFETYKFNDGSGPAYAHNRGVNGHSTPPGIPGLDFDLSVFNSYDAAAAPQSLTVTLTVTGEGVGMLSTGDEVSGGGGTFPVAPGLFVNAILSNSVPAGSVFSLDIEPAWTLKFFSALVRADIIRGMHVGRWPVMPRAGAASWDSVLTFNGANSFEVFDALSGETISYDASLAPSKPGRLAFHNGPASRMSQVYDRHAARDRSRLVYLVTPATGENISLTGVGVTAAEGRALRGTNTAGGVYATAAAEGALLAQAEADADAIAVAVAGLGAHVRAASGAVTLHELTARNYVVAVPPFTVPAGVLCAVVKQASTLYVWRRTPETRGGLDSERNQAEFFVS